MATPISGPNNVNHIVSLLIFILCVSDHPDNQNDVEEQEEVRLNS